MVGNVPDMREDNNLKGKDEGYDHVDPYVHSPIKFEYQRPKEIEHRRDGVMYGKINANGFELKYDVEEDRVAHLGFGAFERTAAFSLDEFIKNPSNIRNENANHTSYDPVHKLVRKDL